MKRPAISGAALVSVFVLLVLAPSAREGNHGFLYGLTTDDGTASSVFDFDDRWGQMTPGTQ